MKPATDAEIATLKLVLESDQPILPFSPPVVRMLIARIEADAKEITRLCEAASSWCLTHCEWSESGKCTWREPKDCPLAKAREDRWRYTNG